MPERPHPVTAEVRGSWRPAWVGLGRLVRARLAHDADRPAWTDLSGTLTHRDLWAHVRGRARRLPPGPLTLTASDPREIVLDALAGLVARRQVHVRGPRAGASAASVSGPPGLTFTTSGTTGPPRPVRTRRDPRAAAQVIGLLGVLPPLRRPVVASVAGVDHGHGFSAFVAALALGGEFIACQQGWPTGRDRVDVLTGVPLQLRELAHDPPPLRHVRLVLSGSDRLDEATATRLEQVFGAPVWNAYGATETGTVTCASPSDRARLPGTVGRPLPGVRIEEVSGRLHVRSPLLGRGTFAGDRGSVRDGLVLVSGRADGAVVTGGETWHPDAVRAWVAALPGVVAASVDVVADARFGRRARLRVETRVALEPAALKEAIRAEFGPAAAPTSVEVVAVD